MKKTNKVTPTPTSVPRWLIVTLGILASVVVVSFLFSALGVNPTTQPPIAQKPTPTSAPSGMSLPSQWKWDRIDNEGENIGKLIKQNSDTVQPTVLVIKSTTNEKDPKSYIDSLVEGLKQTVAVNVLKDTEKKDGKSYRRSLQMQYTNGNDTIAVVQVISVNGKTVRTVTASYNPNSPDKNLAGEVESLVSKLQ